MKNATKSSIVAKMHTFAAVARRRARPKFLPDILARVRPAERRLGKEPQVDLDDAAVL